MSQIPMVGKEDGSHKDNETGFLNQIKDKSNENSMDSIIMEANKLDVVDSDE